MPGILDDLDAAVTPAGRKILRAGRPIAEGVFAASFARLSEKERATLLVMLLRIVGGRELETA